MNKLTVNSLDDLKQLHVAEHDVRRESRISQVLNAISLVRNATSTTDSEFVRTSFLRFILDGNREIDAECGYPAWLTPDHYRIMYDREGISRRVVNCEPEETWAEDPEIFEDENPLTLTKFEQAWINFNKEHNAYHHLQRIDILSGIGQFGILLLGIDDGKPLQEPIDGANDDGTFEEGLQHKILYMRPFSEDCVFCKIRETDPNSPRYGQPKMYTIHFRDFPNWGIQAGEIIARDVHWSRVIHVADNRKMSEVYGTPRMQPVWNRLFDLRKIYASAGEAFWKQIIQTLSFEVNPEVSQQGIPLDKDSIKAQMDLFQRGMQRYLAVEGLTVKSLPVTIADPTASVEINLKAIATTLRIPLRVLFGSEEAKLSSNQDSRAWIKRLRNRQTKYVNPLLIRPFINRLINLGVLPKPKKFDIEWPDLNLPTDQDKAALGLTRTQALSTYISGKVFMIIPPQQYLTQVLGFSAKQANLLIQGMGQFNDDSLLDDGEEDTSEGGGSPAGDDVNPNTIFQQDELSGKGTQGGRPPVGAQLVESPSLNKAE
jgi:hypothetical protein